MSATRPGPSDVDAAVTLAIDAVGEQIRPVGDAATELLEPVRVLGMGGKRLRSRLLLAAATAFGTDDAPPAAVHAAAALELFQAAALLHDDVVDRSQTRRGEPAAHVQFAATHRDRGWDGDADRYGDAGAILAGDLALLCFHVAADAAGPTLSTLLGSMAQTVTAGQFLDVRVAAEPVEALGEQQEAIWRVMRTKTASYTAQYPLLIGAAAAGAGSPAQSAMADAGADLGIAFQLRDDLLGLTGDAAVTGKPVGDDVREGKRTYAMWWAWTHGSDADRAAIRATLGDADAADTAVDRVIDIIHATGAVDEVEARIGALHTSATAALDQQHLSGSGAQALTDLARAAIDRRA